jgi:uncharacterized protein (TIGR03435 family)
MPAREPDMRWLDHYLTGVFPAVYDQIGIRVEARKAPREVLAIDHIDKTPTEN